MLVRAVPILDKGGGIREWVGVHTDIDAERRAEAALREAEERARLLLESSGEGIYGIDTQGRCTFINRAAAEMLGYRAEDVLGQNVHALIHHTRPDGSPYPAEDCPIYRTFRTGKGCRVDDEVLWRRDGTAFPAEYASYPLRGGDGEIKGAVVNFTDITERKQAERELVRAKEAAEAATRAKSEFLANMSHEIRTPLNGIIGMTELALDTELTPEQREYLGMVKLSADHLLTVINDILDFSKIEAGKLDLESIDFDLRETLDDTVATLATRAHKKGLELADHVAADVPDALVGDPDRAPPGPRQPGRQRDQVHRAGRGGAPRRGASRGPSRRCACTSPSATRASASPPSSSGGSSRRSPRPTPRPPASTAAPGWAWRSRPAWSS